MNIAPVVLLLTAAMLCAAPESGPATMSLQVREGQLRSAPSFLGSVTARLAYAERLEVLETRNGWSKVATLDGARQGWIHASALTPKRIVLTAGDADTDVAASSGELALAGKGFNKDVEAQFKSRNADLDFAAVDRLEKMNVDVRQVRAFLEQGEVTPREEVTP
jgi:SH3-like domain-containing protein